MSAKPSLPLLERTLAIIKPNAVDKEDEIIVHIEKAGFTITDKRTVQITLAQASEFYQDHEGKPFYEQLTNYMSSVPIIVMVLTKVNAIADFKNLLGPADPLVAKESNPKSLRALYGINGQKNACHGSDSISSAEREIRFFFPSTVFDPIPNKESVQTFLETALFPILTQGLVELCKEKPSNPTEWLGKWMIENNPNKPKFVEPEN